MLHKKTEYVNGLVFLVWTFSGNHLNTEKKNISKYFRKEKYIFWEMFIFFHIWFRCNINNNTIVITIFLLYQFSLNNKKIFKIIASNLLALPIFSVAFYNRLISRHNKIKRGFSLNFIFIIRFVFGSRSKNNGNFILIYLATISI